MQHPPTPPTAGGPEREPDGPPVVGATTPPAGGGSTPGTGPAPSRPVHQPGTHHPHPAHRARWVAAAVGTGSFLGLTWMIASGIPTDGDSPATTDAPAVSTESTTTTTVDQSSSAEDPSTGSDSWGAVPGARPAPPDGSTDDAITGSSGS